MSGETFKFASSIAKKAKDDIQNNGSTRKTVRVMDDLSNLLSNAEKEITSSVETGYKNQSSYAAKRIMSADIQHVKKRFKREFCVLKYQDWHQVDLLMLTIHHLVTCAS